jgi:hypothetical protein
MVFGIRSLCGEDFKKDYKMQEMTDAEVLKDPMLRKRCKISYQRWDPNSKEYGISGQAKHEGEGVSAETSFGISFQY